MSRLPRCTLTGRWFDGGLSGVCPLTAHPRCRIPALVSGGPAVLTEKGWLRPERSLVYDQSALLLHHAASTHPGVVFTASQLAGFTKTATRLLTLMRPYPWAKITPLEFPQPEHLIFTSNNNPLLFDLIQLRRGLQQIESLSLHTLHSSTYLAFRRC